jgi:protease I
MRNMTGKRVAILATDGYERAELLEPKTSLEAAGAIVEVLSPKAGEIRSWDKTDWSDSIPVDGKIADADIARYDALVLPGGVINADHLRLDPTSVAFVRRFLDSGKPTAVICHAPWMLVEADVLDGRRLTSYKSLRIDLVNAGAEWVDREVIVDGNLITSRNPGDLPAFIHEIGEALNGVESAAAAE